MAEGGQDIPEADANELLDHVVDRVKIKGGLDINKLKEDGVVFEIDEDAVAVRTRIGYGIYSFCTHVGRQENREDKLLLVESVTGKNPEVVANCDLIMKS